jgi:hypothetical protein
VKVALCLRDGRALEMSAYSCVLVASLFVWRYFPSSHYLPSQPFFFGTATVYVPRTTTTTTPTTSESRELGLSHVGLAK